MPEAFASDLEQHCGTVIKRLGCGFRQTIHQHHMNKADMLFMTERLSPHVVFNGAITLTGSAVIVHGFRLSMHSPSSQMATLNHLPSPLQSFAHELRLTNSGGDGISLLRAAPDVGSHWVHRAQGLHPFKLANDRGVNPIVRQHLGAYFAADPEQFPVDAEWVQIPIYPRVTQSIIDSARRHARRNDVQDTAILAEKVLWQHRKPEQAPEQPEEASPESSEGRARGFNE